jgi:SPP1 gp7 family putative phage head morphogenesis protein
MTVSAIEQAIQRNRAQLLAGDAEALSRMRSAYLPVRSRLNDLIDELVAVLESSDGLTGGQAVRLERARVLLEQVEIELQRFGSGASSFIESAQRQAIQLATAHVQATIFAQDPALGLAFNRVNTRAVETLVGRMADGSPLRSWLDALGPDTAATMEQSIIDGLALGQNPRLVAREIKAALATDVDLAGYRILNHTRTQMLGAYRGATLERYRENADIVQEWEWISAKQATTCSACLGLDGKRFPLTVTFQPSHNQCRCSSLAVLKGVTIERELGSEWLAKQDEKTQANVLGKQGAKEYRAGNVALDDFRTLHRDERWGDSYQAVGLSQAQANADRRAA